ncbi:unnamed protein product [Acanthoscelides obtectus]|uniref:Ig-like domain-containing protein n=1 Tax=Acanthoscelides obtectus TaxID=200917 RepID=A0A9P0KNR2_ACAOB|nr:unnamed protein product [Acanthoscelides obtectus]CAK1660043.1 Leucine-rich repeat, immunoglobulin-like domain and transmembrane domain-containing protein 3 [Acanthoscelides obtectus]
MMDLRSIYLFLLWTTATLMAEEEEDFTQKCNKCSCRWANGKRTANCTNLNFNSIPNDLSSLIREIDFSYNPIYRLDKKIFADANLSNVHKLKLQNCSIEYVDQKAFYQLALLIELDLARNYIKKLHKHVFRETVKMRILILSYNHIKILDDELFRNMSYLQRISLDHNQIESISPETFQNLPSLSHIDLGDNRLQTLDFDLKKTLPRLNSLNVEGNPWICDCHLQEFRQSAIKNSLITTRTDCDSPPKLKGRAWQDNVVFACAPQIIEPVPLTQIEANSANVTLTCKVTGDPTPDVDWTNGGMIVERDPRKNRQKYVIARKTTIDGYTWNNLTIVNVNYRDRGDYKCIAKNPGGEDERNITVLIPAGTSGGIVPGSVSNSVYWIVGLSLGFLVVLLALLLVAFCMCKRPPRGQPGKNRGQEHNDSSEEYINMSGGHADIKKGLITDVNPVTKPPRTSVPPSVVSGGTEVSDVKRNLLDNDSVFECDDESRSIDFEQPLLRKSQPLLDSPIGPGGQALHYPPDLLPFPAAAARAAQVSPAASCASTVADTARLPCPQSPLHSPVYDQLSLYRSEQYRTLPYSRSHSPFVAPGQIAQAQPRVPRHGYVTMPRRPRQQSWSSEPPLLSDLGEPLYDNLGKRTTATGAISTQSLDKLDSNGKATATSTPRTNRMLSPVTTPGGCDPIQELHEHSPPTMASQTLPRNHVLSSSSKPPVSSRTQWARSNAEALRSPEKRNSTASLPPASLAAPIADGQQPPTTTKTTKVPPRPPPKPKKRLSTSGTSTGPLFEDEGEDGTEV